MRNFSGFFWPPDVGLTDSKLADDMVAFNDDTATATILLECLDLGTTKF